MPDIRKRARSGLRPAAYLATIVGLLFVWVLPMFPDYTVRQARTEFAWAVGGTFAVIVALYATGAVTPGAKVEAKRPSPVVVILGTIAIIALTLTECVDL